MVDRISNTRGIGRAGKSRYAAPPAASTLAAADKPVAAIAAGGGATDREGGDRPTFSRQFEGSGDSGLRLEIAEDADGGELVYRFVHTESGEVVRQWDADELSKLRSYVRDKRIHLIDKKI